MAARLVSVDDGAELALDFERVRPTPPELASGCRARDTAAARELLDEFRRLKASGTEEERAAFLFGRGSGVILLDPAIPEGQGRGRHARQHLGAELRHQGARGVHKLDPPAN